MTTQEAAAKRKLLSPLEKARTARAALDELTDEEIHTELGETEIKDRSRRLPDYLRYNTLATFEGFNGDTGMTARQSHAWAAFAETLYDKTGPTVFVAGNVLRTLKPQEERVQAVINAERQHRVRLANLRVQKEDPEAEPLKSWEQDELDRADKGLNY